MAKVNRRDDNAGNSRVDDTVLLDDNTGQDPSKRSPNLTESEIDEVYFRLRSTLGKVSARAVYNELGRGSLSTIHRRVSQLERDYQESELDDIANMRLRDELVDILIGQISRTVANCRLNEVDKKIKLMQESALSSTEAHHQREMELIDDQEKLTQRVAELDNFNVELKSQLLEKELKNQELARMLHERDKELSLALSSNAQLNELLVRLKINCPAVQTIECLKRSVSARKIRSVNKA